MIKRTGGRHSGQILPLLALSAALMFGLAGLGVDLMYLYVIKAKLGIAVDAAALAAARNLARGDTPAEQQAEAEAIADLVFRSNFPSGDLLTDSVVHTAPVLAPGAKPGTRQVSLSGTAVAPAWFMRFFGRGDMTVNAAAIAIRRDVNLMLVLDRSGSMNRAPGSNPGPTAFDDLQAAATAFVDNFDNSRDRLGLVVFGTAARVDERPATNFKADIKSAINAHVADNSGTNLPDAMWLAYNELRVLNDPGALNLIVYFTDGAATVFSADMAVGRGSCAGQTLTGLAQAFSNSRSTASRGLHPGSTHAAPVRDDATAISHRRCGFDWRRDLSSRVPALPAIESHGFSITGPRTIPSWVGRFPRTRGDVIRVAGANATINIAEAARTDANVPIRIFSIGLGGSLPPPEIGLDVDLLMTIANDPNLPLGQLREAQPMGRAIVAPDATQLRAAFDQIANEIYRLIQ